MKRYVVFPAFHDNDKFSKRSLLQFSGIRSLFHVLQILAQKKVVAGLSELVPGNQGLLHWGQDHQLSMELNSRVDSTEKLMVQMNIKIMDLFFFF